MSETKDLPQVHEPRIPNAWIVMIGPGSVLGRFTSTMPGSPSSFPAIEQGDGFLVVDQSKGGMVSFARLYRKRSALDSTTLYFDSVLPLTPSVAPSTCGVALPATGESLARMDWTMFSSVLKKVAGLEFGDMPILKGKSPIEQAYLREMLQLATVDDLMGPACGPEEEIVGMSVRDRYLVGKLAPRTRGDSEAVEGLKGVSAEEEASGSGIAPKDLKPFEETGEGKKKAARRRLPGEEFSSTEGHLDPDDDNGLEVDASKNQSFVPSSIGLTVCVDGTVEAIELQVRWGRYLRTSSEEQTGEDGKALRAWKRIPSGGKILLPLKDGRIGVKYPDPECPKVVVQGTVRSPLPSGDRLITIFLVNDQDLPQQNQDEAWLFQPEITLRHPEGKAVFRRRPVLENNGHDPERESLEMIYRGRVEFAVGHSVSVQAEPSLEEPEKAVTIQTSVLPQYEVAITETPGLDPEDRLEMRRLIDTGYLDMKKLAEIDRSELIVALSIITDDYESWVSEQRSRVGKDVIGYNDAAKQAMLHCDEILQRLREGIDTLRTDDKALQAFRFANSAMANQRIRSIYALERRRKSTVELADLDIAKNRSWRPFQLAFILLSIPALANPTHQDRTNPIEAHADLLWFPTGGGKTEAYLGVAAFTMAIRRIQGNLGGLDSSRGLSVIMRYTLRLLTLQQFQRATTLICAMEVLRRADQKTWGVNPFSIGLWVGQRLTPNDTEASHEAIEAERGGKRLKGSSPAQLTSCPWCGSEISPKRDIEVQRFASGTGRTIIYCGDKLQRCEFSRAKARENGLPAVVVDDEIYRRPPSILIATVDKFAMMAWRGQVRTLFGHATRECPRHGLLWPGADCTGNHQANSRSNLPRTEAKEIARIRPPDLIIQDEFHLISGPLGTMVGLYETAVDELSSWDVEGKTVRPKVIASTATVRKAAEQVNNVFLRKVAVFPPHGLDVEDNFFSVQRSIGEKPGRRYLGICSPGSARPAVLIRVYTALLTAGQSLFDHFGPAIDPWMTVVGYFNSLRELGGMRRLSEDDVQTRAYRVLMSRVVRPGLAQRSVKNVDELTSRVSNKEIPHKLDQLEIAFKGVLDPATGTYKVRWAKEETQAIDVALATNMLSVGVDVNRLGLMVVNGQPKNTAEYIQATSRVGRSFPGLVCTVLTWSRPRDLSHYETFEHYHSTFYKHVEAQSVTPFSPRALDRGLTGTMISWLRLGRNEFNPNLGAQNMDVPTKPEINAAKKLISERCWLVTGQAPIKALAEAMVQERCDEWVKEATRGGRRLGYEKGRAKKQGEDDIAGLLKKPGIKGWDRFTAPMSMREVEPGVRLVMDDDVLPEGPAWRPKPPKSKESGGES
jgi:hypothetical protein